MRIPMEDWLRGCVYHDGRHGNVTLPTDKVLEIANYIQLTRASLTDGMIDLPPYDRKTENSSEIPNNCEHITEYGVTCAKYPACDDCPDNPLNKVKGSERLVKGSEKPNKSKIPTCSTISKMEQVETMSCQECKHWDVYKGCRERVCKYEPKTEPSGYNLSPVEAEPHTERSNE